jgi:hypothetical protein
MTIDEWLAAALAEAPSPMDPDMLADIVELMRPAPYDLPAQPPVSKALPPTA